MGVYRKGVLRSIARPSFIMIRCICLFTVGLLMTVSAPAEIRSDKPMRGDEAAITISLLTILPGNSLYSSFGHTALRVIDRDAKSDLLYNYGQSARPFDIPFLANLVVGRMEFMVDVFKTGDAVRFYKTVENRTIIEQPLNIDQEHAQALKARLEHDSQPANRLYNYRFFTDNCTTRVWLLLKDAVMDHDPEWPPSSPRSLRLAIGQVLASKPMLNIFISFLLGPSADRPRDLETSLFLPHELMDQVGGLLVQGASGRESFVAKPRLLFEAVQEESKKNDMTPMTILLSLAVLSGLLAAIRSQIQWLPLIFDIVLFGAVVAAGLGILLLWRVAGYREVGMNSNLLWATPFPLIGLIWSRLDGRSLRVPAALFALESLGSLAVTVFGGLGGQTVSTEIRIVCAIVLIRCVTRFASCTHGHSRIGAGA